MKFTLIKKKKQLLDKNYTNIFFYENNNFNYDLDLENDKKIIKKLVENNNNQKTNISFEYFIFNSQSKAVFVVNTNEVTNVEQFQKLINDILKNFNNLSISNILLDLSNLDLSKAKLIISNFSKLILDKYYSYKEDNSKSPKNIFFYYTEQDEKSIELEKILNISSIINKYIEFSKYLSNSPANICTPKFLATKVSDVAKKLKQEIKIYDRKDILKIGMGAFLSVAKGSDEGPYFIELTYNGLSKDGTSPVVLVGKGITFDSGGISLKPSLNMDEMKYDMCGASTVISTFFAAVELKLPLNLKVLVPTCENMPSGKASKPGDVVKTLHGLTVEILNTDAEGRLILCDALAYAKRFNPKVCIDVATLTGACIIALGYTASAVIGNDQNLIDDLIKASGQVNDKIWQLPLWDEYGEQLKSNFADLANVGGKGAGTISAASFLSKFVEDYSWAHLDIAGAAWISGDNKTSTGRPIPLLVQYLINLSKN